jgi:hypothetical protein
VNSQTQNVQSNSVVCYCHNQTVQDLLSVYRKEGTLANVQKVTRAGTGCGGCRILLESMFGQNSAEMVDLGSTPSTACVKPGIRVMKSFIIADDHLESTVYSSNAVPPQLMDCDSTTPIEYQLVDRDGRPVLRRNGIIKTNETFIFDTKKEKLPRPFYGMFLYALGRSNFGASRFNVAWSNGRSTTSTHENANTGRPDLVLPILVDEKFLKGPNTVYLAIQNPHSCPLDVQLRTFDVETKEFNESSLSLPALGTKWINANIEFYSPILKRFPKSTVAFRMHTPDLNVNTAPILYFFIHNKLTNLWSSNHM